MPQYYFLAFISLAFASEPAIPMAWGFGTSAYQIEGAYREGGKGQSVWDIWYNDASRTDKPNGNIADDHYHRMKEDIGYLGQLGATAYRFSVSWPRILPNCDGAVNAEGIEFYNNMINEIILNGALPVLTLFHWDTPQACQDRYKSWMDKRIVEDFTNFADVVFNHFGDRLEYVLTINEPSAACGYGFEQAVWPPGMNLGGNARYICQHWSNLAHGSVVNMARKKYKSHNLKFGMPLIVSYGIPLNDNPEDIEAADAFMKEQVDWNWSPIIDGDYSDFLKQQKPQSDLLPVYTEDEKEIMKGTMDFVALNFYTAAYIYADRSQIGGYQQTLFKDGKIIGPVSGTPWQNIYTDGIRGLSNWIYQYYKMDIIITECGVSGPGEQNMTVAEVVNDQFRQDFYAGILPALNDAINVDKVPIKAALFWSLLDNFEWNTYDQRFGVIHVDREGTNPSLNRTLKKSASLISTYLGNSKSPFKLPKVSENSSKKYYISLNLSIFIVLLELCFY